MTIRVFISSTFRDMHAERDYLSRQVFPELRSRCQKRGAEFIGLDLRWGVTEEEARREGALKICLDEIERCRPFFVCLLGARYGWVPPPEEVSREHFEDAVRGGPPIAIADWYALDETSVPPVYRLRRDRRILEDVAESLTRFWEDRLPHAGESITAREILRGVFEEGFPATHALFYLRNLGVEDDPDFPEAFVPVFVEQDARRRAKLADLETKIRACAGRMVVRDYDAGFAGLRIDPSLLPVTLSDEERTGLADGVVTADELDRFSAPVREAILQRGTVALSGLEALGDRILEDLWAAIEKELERPSEALDSHQRERAYHERFVIARTRLFLGRDEVVKRVLDGLADPAGGNLMVVTGAPGSGKSALLAECARRVRERFQGALIIPHFIGASPGSAVLANTLRSISETLKRECKLTEEVPDDPQKLLRKWPEFLEKAGAQRRVILLLDALNQLDALDHSHELDWIPYRMPPGVTLVVSTLPGDCLDRLRRRVSSEAVIDVPALAVPDRKGLVETHLGQRRKKLSPAQLERLLDTTKRPEAGRPLYLLVALEELSLFGSYEALDGRIDLLPPTIAELFDQVLARLEQDHGREMTESICRWIAVSRSGMLESELLDLLVGSDHLFPRARWSRFYHAIESYLRPVEEETGEGLLAFYHDQLRFAVYRRYLHMQSPDELRTDAYREAHGELARYFREAAIEEDGQFPKWRWDRKRSLSELPYHQLSAGMCDVLEQTLTDIGFIEAKSRTGMVYDLARDYAAAEQAWPGQEQERRKEWEREQRLNEYVTKLTGYAHWHDGWRREGRPKQEAPSALLGRFLGAFRRRRRLAPVPGAPPLPEPPIAVARVTELEPAEAAREWTPRERVGAWEHFVSNHTMTLGLGQEPAFQLAYNSVDSGPVADTLADRLRQGGGPTRPWLRLTNRPPFSLHPACLKTLDGGQSLVNAVAVTPDGRCAVSGSENGTLCVWDLQTGGSRVLKEPHSVSAVAVSADGRIAVSGVRSTLRVWDLQTGGSRVLQGPHCVSAVAVTPDGRLAVSGFSGDDRLTVWELGIGRSRVLKGRGSWVKAVAVTPDGRLAVSGGQQGTLCVWDLETGHFRVLEGHRECVDAVAVTPDGRLAVSGSQDKTLRVWDLETDRSHVLKEQDGVSAVAVTADGRRAVAGVWNALCLWDLETGHSRVLKGHTDRVNAVAVVPDGRCAISGGDVTLRLWDLETGHSRLPEGHTLDVRAVALMPDGRRAVSGSADETLRVWELETGHTRVLKGHTKGVRAVAATADGRRAVSGSDDHTLRVWDLETDHTRVLKEHTSGVNAVAVAPDGRCAISGSDDKTLRFWDLETGHSRVLDGHTARVWTVALTPDGRCAISGGDDKTLRVWDLETRQSQVLEKHQGGVAAVAVTPDGRRIVSGGGDATLRVWNLETGQSRLLEQNVNMGSIFAIAVTPDGRRAISGSGNQFWSDYNTLRVWDLETGEGAAIYTSPAGGVQSVAQRFPMLVAGTGNGRVDFLRLVGANYGSPVPLLGPRIMTLGRLWLCAPGVKGGRWADALTATCNACGRPFPAPGDIIDIIAAIKRTACLGPDDSPCCKLPAEAWDEPRLFGECPLCHEPLKFNPFVVDNRDRYLTP